MGEIEENLEDRVSYLMGNLEKKKVPWPPSTHDRENFFIRFV